VPVEWGVAKEEPQSLLLYSLRLEMRNDHHVKRTLKSWWNNGPILLLQLPCLLIAIAWVESCLLNVVCVTIIQCNTILQYVCIVSLILNSVCNTVPFHSIQRPQGVPDRKSRTGTWLVSPMIGSLIMCVAGLERIALGGFSLCKWIGSGLPKVDSRI
jgi:hypothetical protein